jgi:hypothetical protein
MGYSGAWGTLIYEKNLMLKISCHTPFKEESPRLYQPCLEAILEALLCSFGSRAHMYVGNHKRKTTFIHSGFRSYGRAFLKNIDSLSLPAKTSPPSTYQGRLISA